MFKKWLWRYRQLTRKLWFRATFYCIIGIASALVALVLGPFIPDEFSQKIGAKSVDTILNIIASSMLAVTTFSLTTMVSATSAASSSATPRVSKLFIEDTTSHRALSTFLGAFLFSLVSLIALNTGMYSQGGRVVLLAITLSVITLIVITLLRWISHLTLLGRLGEAIDRTEAAAIATMKDYHDNPLYGARQAIDIPSHAQEVLATDIGYIEHLAMDRLSDLCTQYNATIHLKQRPGSFADRARPVAFVATHDQSKLTDEQLRPIADAITISDSRSFEQDPRFGLVVLCEIGQRALSPATNDPGTAIEVINTLVRVLSSAPDVATYDDTPPESQDVTHPHVYIPPLQVKDFMEDAFMLLARDGASLIEINLRIQKACRALSVLNEDFRAAAHHTATLSYLRAIQAMPFRPDHQRLRQELAFEDIASANA